MTRPLRHLGKSASHGEVADAPGEPAARPVRHSAAEPALDNLSVQSLPALDWQAPEVMTSLDALFRWVEAGAIDAYSWYLREKEKKSRASKALRISAVVAIALGSMIPVLALILGPHLNAEWGFVVLAFGAAILLLDRAFGFSRSWARYVATAMEIKTVLTRAQLAWARRCATGSGAGPGTDGTAVAEALTEIEELARQVGELIKQETAEWASEVHDSLAELGQNLDTRPVR
jgi:SMODS and SLOG-associating 2TM effector domain 2